MKKSTSKITIAPEVAVRIDRLAPDLRRIVSIQIRELVHEFDDAICANTLDFSPAQFGGRWANLQRYELRDVRKAS